jgi:lipopolysaccharide export system permease protein
LFKKLDILVVRAFISPFFATFLIAEFVLTLQFFWLYLDDMVGKGLNFFILLKLISLVVVNWIPLALPLAMLLSSIMTFGNLGETFEIVAIKAAGISLLRFMRPLIIVACLITVIAFLSLNYFIPVSILKLESLKHDIIVKQPAFDIKEGVFYNKIPGFVIKIGKKEKDDSTIKNIVIFETNNATQDNAIVASSGVMRLTADKKFLEFILYNGCRYEERGIKNSLQTDYIRMGFKQYSKLLDLSSLQMSNTNQNGVEKNAQMLSVRQIDYTLDSLKKYNKSIATSIYNQSKILFNFSKYKDTGWLKKDTFKYKATTQFSKLIPDSVKALVYQNNIIAISIALGNITNATNIYKQTAESLKNYEIEWHKRFTFSIACLVLFLIGAPLGSIIRKGGLGTPLVFAIGFFAIFHLLNTFGSKLAKEGVLSSFTGIWLSTFVLTPVALFLIYKALKDAQLFNSEFYFRFFRKIKALINK